MSVEKDISQIKDDIVELKKQGKRSAWADAIQITAIVLVFFFSVETIRDLKKIIK